MSAQLLIVIGLIFSQMLYGCASLQNKEETTLLSIPINGAWHSPIEKSHIHRFHVRGKMAISHANGSDTLRFDWVEGRDNTSIALANFLGINIATIFTDDQAKPQQGRLVLRQGTASSQRLESDLRSDSLEALLAQAFNLPAPLPDGLLKALILGRDLEKWQDIMDRSKSALTNLSWEVGYREPQDSDSPSLSTDNKSHALPQRLTLKLPPTHIKIFIERWETVGD